MNSLTILVIYCVLILLASVLGGWVPLFVRLTHTRLQLASSFIGGLMLGVGMLHLFPHAVSSLGSVDKAVQALLAGFMGMFFIQRFFDFHKHDVPEELSAGEQQCHHGEDSGELESKEPSHSHSTKKWSWGGAAFGLTVHTVINGVVLAASVEAEVNVGGITLGLAGLGTFLVIFLHKPFDALTIGTLMAVGGWKERPRHVVNILFALMIPLGVALFYLGHARIFDDGAWFIGLALAFASGTFLCIAASDLLPELHFHHHDRVKLSLALLAGLGLAVLVGFFESGGHGHDHNHDDHNHGPVANALEISGAELGIN